MINIQIHFFGYKEVKWNTRNFLLAWKQFNNNSHWLSSTQVGQEHPQSSPLFISLIFSTTWWGTWIYKQPKMYSLFILSMGFPHKNIAFLAPWKESYDKPRQCIKKQRHHFADKSLYSQSYVFLAVMYRCESRTIKKSEWGRTDAFELGCWRRLLRVPWTARRSNQSILKEINPEYSLEGLMLQLKVQYFGHLMWRVS